MAAKGRKMLYILGNTSSYSIDSPLLAGYNREVAEPDGQVNRTGHKGRRSVASIKDVPKPKTGFLGSRQCNGGAKAPF